MHKKENWWGRFARYGPGRLLPDKAYISMDYFLAFGKRMDWQHPKTYSEKIQWLKLHDRKPEYHVLADKLAVREYILQEYGGEYLIPLLGVYDSYEEIDFNKLPDRFVLKPNHSSGDIFLCEDKSRIDHIELKKEIDRWLKRDYYLEHREWQYKGLERKILCEEYLHDSECGEPWNYRFFSFNGNPRVMSVVCGKLPIRSHNHFDMDFNPLPVWERKRTIYEFVKPEGFDKMLEIVKDLVKPFIHIRMDMYLISGKIYIGEFTLHHFSGLVKWEPEGFDLQLGEMMKLPGLED